MQVFCILSYMRCILFYMQVFCILSYMHVFSILSYNMHVFCNFCFSTCSAQLSMFHMEKCSRNAIITAMIIIIMIQNKS